MVELSSAVRGIIPAGVHPWGDSCLDEVIPRVLLPVIGTPLIAHGVEWLRNGGVTSMVICANSASPLVRTVLGDGQSLAVDLTYFDDLTPRGPAGCARDASTLSDGERFVVVDGTVVPRFSLAAMLETHARSGAAATVAMHRDRSLDGPQRDHLVPLGVYIIERRALETVSETGYQDTKEVLIPRLHEAGQHVLPYEVESVFPRIGDASSYLAATEWLLGSYLREAAPPCGYRRRGDALIHSSASVSPEARIVGPVLIGPRSDIEDGAVLLGPLVVGSACMIAAHAAICRTVLWNSCRIGPDGYLDNCIVTDGVALPAGAQHYGMLLTSRDASAGIQFRRSAAGAGTRFGNVRGRVEPGADGQRAARSLTCPEVPGLG